jgi:hypothetical protein
LLTKLFGINVRPFFFKEEIVVRLLAAVLGALVLFSSGFTTGTTLAQEVPVLGEDGWILPLQETSDELMETFNEVAPDSAPAMSSGGGSVGSYEAAIYDACARHGCDPSQLIRVMYCESGGDPNAVGPNGELGIFQVDPRYWGYMDSWQQIEFAAYMFATGQGYNWVCQ